MASSVSFPGIGSGIDSASLAKALYDQLTLPNRYRSNQVSDLKEENSSLEDLRSKLLSLADKLDNMRTVNGGMPSVVAESSNTDIVSVAADSSVNLNSFKVSVESLANSASGSFNRDFSSRADFIVADSSQTGDVSFSVGSSNEQFDFSVSVGEFTTPEGFVNQFNQKAKGHASASLINLGTELEPKYRISFSTNEAGTSRGSLAITYSNLGLANSEALGSTTLEQATDARFQVSGISGSITRDTNSISDVLQGVSFELHSTGSVDVSISQDADAALKSLSEFVGAFNDIVEFISKEDAITTTKVDGESVNIYGSLARTDVDDRALEDLRGVIRSVSVDKVSLASLGVETKRDGTLAVNEDKFRESFNKNSDASSEVLIALADKIGGVSGVAYQYTGYQNQIDQSKAANEEEINNINDTIDKVDRTAKAREETLLKQFSSLEGTIAQLNQNASVIASLLNF